MTTLTVPTLVGRQGREESGQEQLIVLRFRRCRLPVPGDGKRPGQPGSKWHSNAGGIIFIPDREGQRMLSDEAGDGCIEYPVHFHCSILEDVGEYSPGRAFKVKIKERKKAERKKIFKNVKARKKRFLP